MKPKFERLEDRCIPTTAVFSFGSLVITGDNLGNNINVYSDHAGEVHVSERNIEISVLCDQPLTLGNLAEVSEYAGNKNSNTLSSSISGNVSIDMYGAGSGLTTFNPLGTASCVAYGSQSGGATSYFHAGKGVDDFFGGAGQNTFWWMTGDASGDQFHGSGTHNAVSIFDSVQSQVLTGSNGGLIYSWGDPGSFSLDMTDIQVISLHAPNNSTYTIDAGVTGLNSIFYYSNDSVVLNQSSVYVQFVGVGNT